MSPTFGSERYQVADRIGEGGIGVVYRVTDRTDGEVRAMKVIPRTGGVTTLRSEFLSLARIDHDNIVRVHDYGLTDAGHDFFTMDYVEGPTLFEAVPDVASPAFYPVIGGILRALALLHARGVVHADVKPSNILIDAEALADEPLCAAKLVDFGLAAHLSDPGASVSRGTFPYAAPEVYAGRLDARSDLYALGVVLYELATGAKPWSGDDVAQTLAAQRRGPPADPREARPECPDQLSELILGLLDPSPAARPQTADEVLARINDIAGTNFAIADSRPLVDFSGQLTGRERDLAELERLLHDARAGRGSAVLLSGEEGIGKSRLMAELKLRTQLAGGAAYTASAASRAGVPYAGVAELVRGFLADVGIRRRETDALAPLFGARGETDVADPETRFALAEAVAAVVLEAAAARPLLILIDDAELADPGTVELLAYLARSVDAGAVLLVLSAQRGSEGTPGKRAATEPPYAGPGTSEAGAARLADVVGGIAHGHEIHLPPLDRGSVHRMVAETFGAEIATAVSAELHRATGGNPAHAAHALQSLVERGAIRRERGRWILADASPSIPMPPTVVAAATGRADALAKPSRYVLDAAAVLGERFRNDVLGEVLGEADVMPALMDAVGARLVGADPGTGWFYFAHPALARALYRSVDRERRRELHRRAAQVLAAHVDDGDDIPPEALAVHYLAVRDPERGATWSVRAAEARREMRDYHGALAWYERARPLVGDDDDLAPTLDERLGDLHAMLGDAAMASVDYRRALDATRSEPARHIEVAGKLAELLRRRGEGDEALELLQRVLKLAREHKLQREEALVQLMLGQVLMYRADYTAATENAVAGLLIARAVGDRATAAELGRLRASIDIYLGDPVRALEHLDESLADAEAGGGELAVAEVQFGIGRASIHAGDYPRAIDSCEKAIPVFERAGRVKKLASSINNLGAAHYYQGDWTRCREAWERFRALCQRLDEKSELVNALNNLGSLYRDLGELTEAEATLERGAEVAERVGYAHMRAMIEGNLGEVQFRRADLAGARAVYDKVLAEFQEIGAREDVVETKRRLCEVDIALGRINEALDRAIDTIREAQDAGAKFEEGILHRVAAAALRHQGDLDSATWFCERSRELLGTLGARFERAKVDLEAAEILAAESKPDEAEARFGAAIEAFADLGARWHLTRARNRRRGLRPPSKQAARGTAGRGDVLIEVAQVAGRFDLDRLLGVILDKILEVTNFDRGFILLLDADGRPSERMRRVRGTSQQFGKDDAVFSGSIVRRVAASGDPIAVTDVADDVDLRDQASVVSLGLRQVMCAPMSSRGRTFGIVYVDSRRLPHDERAADLSLLEALAAQASVAIENARLFEEERRKTELMGILAHEIRNPLAGILGFSMPAETEDEDAEDPRKLLDHIHRDAQRLKRLVDNVLELTRHETGATEWSMAPFDIEPLVEDVRASYLAATREREIDIELELDISGPALGNPDRIMQVLNNLVGNAVKFAPDGSAITIRARNEVVPADDPQAPPAPPSDVKAWAPTSDEGERETLRVDVVDRGPGMSEDVRDSLFEKFKQGRAKRSKGTGLGLYISREIIHRHGGTIWVDSEPGQGATFSFRIPSV